MSAFSHEVHAAEDDAVRLLAGGGLLRELEGVSAKVSPADDLVTLVVVAEDHQPRAEAGLRARDAMREFLIRHASVAIRYLGLHRSRRGDRVPLTGARAVER